MRIENRTRQVKKIISTMVIPQEYSVYITDDGKEFENPQEAQKWNDAFHRENTFKERYKWKKVEIGGDYYEAVFIYDQMTATTELKTRYSKLDHTKLLLGWNLIKYVDDGDYGHHHDVYNPIIMIMELKSEINQIESMFI